MFCAVTDPWNSGKSAKSREIHKNTKNTAKFGRNLIKYMSVHLQIYLRTSSLKRANNVLKLPGVDYVGKNWALAMMLKVLLLVHFWSVLLLKEQMMTSVRKMLKMLVWSAQNRLIPSEIFLESNHKIGRFLPIAFRWSLPWKLLRNYCEMADFSANLSLKIPRNLTFSSATCQKPRY